MKQTSYRFIFRIFIIVLLTLFIGRPLIERGISHIPTLSSSEYGIEIVDDSGFKIRMDKPAKRIVSLYSAHTENLFALGLENEIVGVGTSESYPVAALEKPQFDYKADPEKVIAAQPDLVVIRPFVERHNPGFVDALRRAGLTVVSLYPQNATEFDSYIVRLGKITGRDKKAEQLLSNYYAELDTLKAQTKTIEDPVGVYFESSDREYKTITEDSMAAKAIAIAGGKNVATGVTPIQEGSSIAVFGLEHIVEIGDQIDVFVTQRGVMGSGGNWHSISIRPGFDTIEAIKNHRVLEINQKIISSPTFRQTIGIKELMRYFYPEKFNNYSHYDTEKELSRRAFANLSVLYMKKPIFVPTARYFRSDYRGHKFGHFQDIFETDEDYYFLETAVISGYLQGYKEDALEYFYPDQPFTREELAQFIFLIGDYKNLEQGRVINDIDNYEGSRVIQILVDHGIFSLDDGGNFNGHEPVTGREVIQLLENL